MNTINLFPTSVYVTFCNLDLQELESKCYEHQKLHPSTTISNVGGYQGHKFSYEPLVDIIAKSFPQKENKKLQEFSSNMWVNINKQGDWNDIHDHDPYAGTALSGVFYVKTPKNCGRIRFYDPRDTITKAPDMKYYNDGDSYYYFDPEPNLLIIFPAWLKHMVEPNNSAENRISISFNIKFKY